MTEGAPAAGPSPMAFIGLAAGPEAQGRETLLSPPFGEAAGDTAPDSSPLFPVDSVAGWWDPTVVAGGGGGRWFSSWQGWPALPPLQAASPHQGLERGRAGLWSTLGDSLLSDTEHFALLASLSASLPLLLPQTSPPLFTALSLLFAPFPPDLSVLSSLLPFIPFFFPHFLTSHILSSFPVRTPPLSLSSRLPTLHCGMPHSLGGPSASGAGLGQSTSRSSLGRRSPW